jgi:hypothetical protein
MHIYIYFVGQGFCVPHLGENLPAGLGSLPESVMLAESMATVAMKIWKKHQVQSE